MKKSIAILFCAWVLASCHPSLKADDLYGEWKYIKVENPNNHPPDSVSAAELKEKSPSIIFAKDSALTIMCGGEKLSYGTFSLQDDMIRYTENLPEGGKRSFPFIVRKIDDKEIVFETMVQQLTKVTARKVN